MKKFLTFFSAIAIIATVAVSCQEDSVDDVIETPTTSTTTGTTLYVSDPSTRVSFKDNTVLDTDGNIDVNSSYIDLDWEDGDTFSLYDSSGNYVCDFTCETAANSDDEDDIDIDTFTSKEDLKDGTYTAIYPASDKATLDEAKDAILDSVETQDGDEINDLDASCYMLAEGFTYSSSSIPTITFEHQMAIMKFTFASDDALTLKKLVFVNGDDYYTVNYNKSPETNTSSSYLMINPCSAVESTEEGRTLKVYFYTTDLTIPECIYTATTTLAYEAGAYYSTTLKEKDTDATKGWTSVDVDKYVFEYGTGTVGDPYQISTSTELEHLSTLVSYGETYEDKYFKLTDDIDLSETTWTPIGRSSTDQFAGIFDGDGHEIKLCINSASGKQGLFGYLASTGVVCNLGVSGEVTSYNESGVCWETAGIVAYNHGLIINCYNSATVSGNANVGGIVGHNEYGYVVNCYNTGDIRGTDDGGFGRNIGGLVGQNDSDAAVVYSYNRGTVSGGTATIRVGGVAGWNNISTDGSTKGTISGCWSLGVKDGNNWTTDCIGQNGTTTDGAYTGGQLEELQMNTSGGSYSMSLAVSVSIKEEDTTTTTTTTYATNDFQNLLIVYACYYNSTYTDSKVEACPWVYSSKDDDDGYPVHDYDYESKPTINYVKDYMTDLSSSVAVTITSKTTTTTTE